MGKVSVNGFPVTVCVDLSDVTEVCEVPCGCRDLPAALSAGGWSPPRLLSAGFIPTVHSNNSYTISTFTWTEPWIHTVWDYHTSVSPCLPVSSSCGDGSCVWESQQLTILQARLTLTAVNKPHPGGQCGGWNPLEKSCNLFTHLHTYKAQSTLFYS